eukprot:3257962-Rhodomonas_salina.2
MTGYAISKLGYLSAVYGRMCGTARVLLRMCGTGHSYDLLRVYYQREILSEGMVQGWWYQPTEDNAEVTWGPFGPFGPMDMSGTSISPYP